MRVNGVIDFVYRLTVVEVSDDGTVLLRGEDNRLYRVREGYCVDINGHIDVKDVKA